MSINSLCTKKISDTFFVLFIYLTSLCYSQEKSAFNSDEINSLISYVQNKDNFNYTLVDSVLYDGATLYRIKMNSGKWLNKNIVNETDWWHWVDIIIPDTIATSTSLLFIGLGTKYDNQIFLDSLSINKAIKTNSVVSYVSNIPYQPLVFNTSDNINRYEDNLIAYGWNQFLKGGAKKEDKEWLARFPMTRAVVRAMDVIEEYTLKFKKPVKEFFITGASKRGWTTWTTAAVDKRVIGMAPIVIDMLKIVPSFEHHYRVYGDWSPAVEDYVEFNIMDWMFTDEFKTLLNYIEPYQFRHLFTMPKLVINGTIDEFFVTDSWKFYWNEIPEKKYLQYVPNGNHELDGTYQTQNVFSFYNYIINKKDFPRILWKIENDIFNVDVEKGIPYEINLWKTNNPKSRDFRIWEVGKSWVKTKISRNKSGSYSIKAPFEEEGFTASLVEIVFYPETDKQLVFTTGTLILPERYLHSPFKPSLD